MEDGDDFSTILGIVVQLHVSLNEECDPHVYFQFPRITPSYLNFKPRVDGDVLVAPPYVTLEAGDHHRVPVMIGVVEEEWARSMGWFYRELKDVGELQI